MNMMQFHTDATHASPSCRHTFQYFQGNFQQAWSIKPLKDLQCCQCCRAVCPPGLSQGPGQFSFPKGLGLTENGGLLVCDSANHRVQVGLVIHGLMWHQVLKK